MPLDKLEGALFKPLLTTLVRQHPAVRSGLTQATHFPRAMLVHLLQNLRDILPLAAIPTFSLVVLPAHMPGLKLHLRKPGVKGRLPQE